MGDFYFKLSGKPEFKQQVLEALCILADPANQPLVFHCSAGKDRTGILAALVLDILGVDDRDIGQDYDLTAMHPRESYNTMNDEHRLAAERNGLPKFFWEVRPELILSFLDRLRKEYGSVESYLREQGADSFLFHRLRSGLRV